MTLFDHLYVALLLVLPVYGWYSFRRTVALARARRAPAKRRLYRQNQVLEWCLFACVAALWLANARPLAGLGFAPPGGAGFWAGALLAALGTAYLVYAWRSARHMDQADRERQYEALGDLRFFLPDTPRDYRHFAALSVTAGIVEEIVYRGFLIWYLAAFVPVWGAIVASSAVFALGHSYQGVGGMLRVFVVGNLFGALYVMSGSIWIPIVLHILLDVLQGATLLEIARKSGPRLPAPGTAG